MYREPVNGSQPRILAFSATACRKKIRDLLPPERPKERRRNKELSPKCGFETALFFRPGGGAL
jgi:hypothetical protein